MRPPFYWAPARWPQVTSRKNDSTGTLSLSNASQTFANATEIDKITCLGCDVTHYRCMCYEYIPQTSHFYTNCSEIPVKSITIGESICLKRMLCVILYTRDSRGEMVGFDIHETYFLEVNQYTLYGLISSEPVQNQRVSNSLIIHHLITFTSIRCGNIFAILVPKHINIAPL